MSCSYPVEGKDAQDSAELPLQDSTPFFKTGPPACSGLSTSTPDRPGPDSPSAWASAFPERLTKPSLVTGLEHPQGTYITIISQPRKKIILMPFSRNVLSSSQPLRAECCSEGYTDITARMQASISLSKYKPFCTLCIFGCQLYQRSVGAWRSILTWK